MMENTQDSVELDTSVPATVEPADENPGQDTPQATAADADGGKQEQAKEEERKFSQAELEAILEKRLRKAERQFYQRQQREAQQQSLKQAAAVEPKREAFADDDAYLQAKLEQIAAQKAEQLFAQREAQAKAAAVAESFQAKAEAASEKYADFDIVVSNPSLRINAEMAEFIADSDVGAEVAYHLGKNPTLAARIADMTPIKAARELTRIESELASKPKATPSRAPEPITPVGSRGRSSVSALATDDDDMETWVRKERERLAKQGRR